MSLVQPFYDILENPTILGVCTGMVLFFGPIWVAFFVGVVVGWAWKPTWASLGREELSCSLAKSLDWCSALSSPAKPVFSSLKGSELQSPSPESLVVDKGMDKRPSSSPPKEYCSSSRYLAFRLLSIILLLSLKLELSLFLLVYIYLSLYLIIVSKGLHILME